MKSGSQPHSKSLIYVPSSLAAAIYSQVPGATNDTADSTAGGTQFYMFPCGANITIAFTFAGIANASFGIDLADLNIGASSDDSSQCIGSVIGQDATDGACR